MPEVDKDIFDQIDNSLRQINEKKKMLNESIEQQLSIYKNKMNKPSHQKTKSSIIYSVQQQPVSSNSNSKSKQENEEQSSLKQKSDQKNKPFNFIVPKQNLQLMNEQKMTFKQLHQKQEEQNMNKSNERYQSDGFSSKNSQQQKV